MGELFLMESLAQYLNKFFATIVNESGVYLKTSCGDIKIHADIFTLTTKNSVYKFKFLSVKKSEASNDIVLDLSQKM